MIEFLPWYVVNNAMLRCSKCGALVMSDDCETHRDWHAS